MKKPVVADSTHECLVWPAPGAALGGAPPAITPGVDNPKKRYNVKVETRTACCSVTALVRDTTFKKQLCQVTSVQFGGSILLAQAVATQLCRAGNAGFNKPKVQLIRSDILAYYKQHPDDPGFRSWAEDIVTHHIRVWEL